MLRFVLVVIVVLGNYCTQLNGQQLEVQLRNESMPQLTSEISTKGDAKRGASVFYREALSCFRCHDPIDGRRLGPNLTEKREVTTEYLVQSLLDPSAKIRAGFEQHLFQLADGRVLGGIIVSDNGDRVVLDRIEEQGKPLEIMQEDIEGRKVSTESSMPTGLVNQLENRQDFLDLVAYLKTIANQGPGAALQLKPINAGQVLPLPAYEANIDHAKLIGDRSETVMSTGAEIFRLRCASCHGDMENEGSMPTSLRFAEGKFKRGSDPYSMYQTLTHGLGMMIPQRTLVPRQKYAVIHYIRETFVKPHNPGQYTELNNNYLAALPKGEALGPEAKSGQAWSKMDYGPSFINTIEVPLAEAEGNDDSIQNIAQKGIAIRLDPGEGGVAAGKLWYMFDHDTMRMSAIWDGLFIDYNGIHFNGVHGRHPKVNGRVLFSNNDGPGWADPDKNSFLDTQRVDGRDNRKYGPLPKNWAQYHGMYRYGQQTVLSYSVGDAQILESPMLQVVEDTPIVVRQLEVGPRSKPITLQVAQLDGENGIDEGVCLSRQPAPASNGSSFDGTNFVQTKTESLAWSDSGYVVKARIRTTNDGTIIARTKQQTNWMPDGQTLFIRDGRLAFDMGWVGAVVGKTNVADGKWHDVTLSFRANDGRVQLQVDGKVDNSGTLLPKTALEDPVFRIGFTNDNFPAKPNFRGDISSLTVQTLPGTEANKRIEWKKAAPGLSDTWQTIRREQPKAKIGFRFIACLDANDQVLAWTKLVGTNVRMEIPAGGEWLRLRIAMGHSNHELDRDAINRRLSSLPQQDLKKLIQGGPANWPQTMETVITSGAPSGGFVTDTFTLPEDNPWNCRLRLSGIDFSPDGNIAYVCSWDGGVWKLTGIGNASGQKVEWRRIAAGLFQPLGIKLIDGVIYVTCRDQLVALHDLNGDGEMDWYRCHNNDHQVTPHFHEFAMGLQTDADGNFYYAKSARHALPAVVPHHGTLLKVSADGSKTEIIANGFRAANGVCLNPDGSFVVTDQEGHWNPKNRINWVKPGQFYGNMFGYHDIKDASDEAMTQPLCWITNEFDRSPAELLWVESEKWGPLNGKLLNLSYGYGKAYVVPFEEINGQKQGGMCAFDIPAFPTGIMRGRFRPQDGQLYCCGLFAWSSTQETPGGLYRLRATGDPFHLPIELHATKQKLTIKFTEKLDPDSITVENFAVKAWDLKRTANYGSQHYNERSLAIKSVKLLPDGKSVSLKVPDLEPTWGMEIVFALQDLEGNSFENRIHNSIYQLPEDRKSRTEPLNAN